MVHVRVCVCVVGGGPPSLYATILFFFQLLPLPLPSPRPFLPLHSFTGEEEELG